MRRVAWVTKKTKPETLRDYWTKKKEKKKEREKRRRERRSVSGEAESEDMRHKTSMKAACLTPLSSPLATTLTSVDEGTLHTSTTSEGIPSSTHYNSDDDLLDFNDFESEATSPKPPVQALQDEDLDMDGVSSPNQFEGNIRTRGRIAGKQFKLA